MHDALSLAAPLKTDALAWPNPANGREDLRFAVTVTNGADVAVKRLVLGARDDSRLAVRHVAGRIAAEELSFGRGAVGYVLGGGKAKATLAAGSVRGDGFAPVTLRVLKGSRVLLAAPWHGDVVCEPGGKVVRRVD